MYHRWDCECTFGINLVQEVIEIHKKQKFGTNQAIMEIGMPSDIILEDLIKSYGSSTLASWTIS